jgi:Na+-transporting NADH:ubiquinone oxidoreductase subunit NqrF
MSDRVRIQLQPLGEALEVERGTPLKDCLFARGVEFPCGGKALCKGCRVRVLSGALPRTPEDEQVLTPEELAAGWRLACRAQAVSDLTLELAQWEAAISSPAWPG